MRPIRSKLLASFSLAAYASVALLGHGLHWLTEAGHHHGRHVVECCTHGAADGHGHSHAHSHCAHNHSHHGNAETCHVQVHAGHKHVPAERGERDNGLAFRSSDCVLIAHECDVCAFLLQIRSERPQIAAVSAKPTIVDDAPASIRGLYSAAAVGMRDARGPPAIFVS